MGGNNMTQIYVGLKDSSTHEQKYPTEKYVGVLKNVCKNYSVAFSFNIISGGYFHEDGSYVEEDTLMLTLVNTPDETVNEIAVDLCTFFHQESVMVISHGVGVSFIGPEVSL